MIGQRVGRGRLHGYGECLGEAANRQTARLHRANVVHVLVDEQHRLAAAHHVCADGAADRARAEDRVAHRGNTTMASMPRSVVVTGAADGIGRGIATRFAEMGDRVALLDYDADKLARTTADLAALGGQVLGIPTDVRSAEAVDAAIAQIARCA